MFTNRLFGMGIQTCPKCSYPYMQRFSVDFISATLAGHLGRMKCPKCNYVEGIHKAKCWKCGETKKLYACNLCEECYKKEEERIKRGSNKQPPSVST